MPNNMRTENANLARLLSRQASSAITRNRLCKDVGPNLVAQCGAGEKCTSVSRYAAAAGAAASQQYAPSDVLIEAGGTIPAGGEFVAGANGVALTAVGAASGSWICGRNTGAQITVGFTFAGKLYDENVRQVP